MPSKSTARSAKFVGDVELVAADGTRTTGTAELRRSSDGRGWTGVLRPKGVELLPLDPGEYEIRLPDGGDAQVIVSRATLRAGGGRVTQEFELLGNGRAPF